jgi:hypothetical protein
MLSRRPPALPPHVIGRRQQQERQQEEEKEEDQQRAHSPHWALRRLAAPALLAQVPRKHPRSPARRQAAPESRQLHMRLRAQAMHRQKVL